MRMTRCGEEGGIASPVDRGSCGGGNKFLVRGPDALGVGLDSAENIGDKNADRENGADVFRF